jgi:hypothetical protein
VHRRVAVWALDHFRVIKIEVADRSRRLGGRTVGEQFRQAVEPGSAIVWGAVAGCGRISRVYPNRSESRYHHVVNDSGKRAAKHDIGIQ